MNQEGPAKSEKEVAWNQNRAEVDQITDKLGLGIDEKIKEVVTAFRAHGFQTNQSCEGHLREDEHGSPFPWIQIYAPEPAGWKESTGQERENYNQEWTMKNLRQQKKMMDFFEEFYQNRDTPFDARLTFDRVGGFGGFRVESFGANMLKLLSFEEKSKKLEL